MLRLIAGVPFAVGVTLSLFFLMRALIHQDLEPPKEDVSVGKIQIARDVRDETTAQQQNQKRPEQRDSPPPPPKITSSRRPPKQDSIDVNIGDVGVRIDPNGGFRSDSDVQPIVRVPPQYPVRAAERGIQGWVLIEFTVTETGSVVQPSIVDADPPNTFNRAALRAVVKWKYKPMMVSGKPVAWKTQVVLTFELEDE
jgi:protein TonB